MKPDTAEQKPQPHDLMVMDAEGYAQGFRVVVEKTIGEVDFGSGSGDVSPYQAAFRLIGDCGEQGTFRFPHEDGGDCVVTVEVRER